MAKLSKYHLISKIIILLENDWFGGLGKNVLNLSQSIKHQIHLLHESPFTEIFDTFDGRIFVFYMYAEILWYITTWCGNIIKRKSKNPYSVVTISASMILIRYLTYVAGAKKY